MIYDVALVMFPILVIVSSLFIIKKFFGSKDEAPCRSPITQNTQEVHSAPKCQTQPKRKGVPFLLPVIGLAAVAFIITQNQELIEDFLKSKAPTGSVATAKPVILDPLAIQGHEVVDGMNWFKIIATSTSGIAFEGWVNEMGIHKNLPKTNKSADALMEKLGLPTNEERIKSIKALNRVGGALKESLQRRIPETD